MERILRLLGGAVLITAMLSAPAFPQGKSPQDHGNGGGGGPSTQNAKKGGQGADNVTPPSEVSLAAPASVSTTVPATPFAWVDNATLMQPGTVWVGVSMTRWQNDGFSETSVPVLDAAFGVSPRLQVGASVPRVRPNDRFLGEQGGAGTTFLSGKVALLNDTGRHLRVAVTPMLEILSRAALQWMPADTSRVQWGLPASIEFDRGSSRIYGSAGHFSPRIWYTGGGGGAQLTPRLMGTLSFSRAWSSASPASSSSTTPLPVPIRHDVALGLAYELTSNISLFGSLGRTFKTAPQFGAGTTVSIGMSLTATKALFQR